MISNCGSELAILPKIKSRLVSQDDDFRETGEEVGPQDLIPEYDLSRKGASPMNLLQQVNENEM